MKIKYHQQHNKKRRISQVALFTIITLLIIGALSQTVRLGNITQSLYANAVSSTKSTEDILSKIGTTFTPKASLLKENQSMREELQKAKVIFIYNSVLKLENEHLRTLLNNPLGKSLNASTSSTASSTARIIDYKEMPYGTILASLENANTNNTSIGHLARFGNLAIGEVIEQNGAHLLIKLFTASDEVHDVLIGDTSGSFIGDSNSSGKVILSRTKKILIGTAVSMPAAGGLLLGTVEEIQRNTEESLQTILIRMPVNIRELRFITIDNE